MDHLIDPASADVAAQWHFSHAVRSRGLLFLSGVTGTRPDGTIDPDPRRQFDDLFRHLADSLTAGGADAGDLVEITTYHVGLREHFGDFVAAKDLHVPAPYPAWSAIGVAELLTPGALVELRAIAEVR